MLAELSGIDADCGVIEIGAGIGVLTAELAKRSKKVVSLELDTKLLPLLDETLADFDNVTIVNADILKIDIDELISQHFSGMRVFICANLPYYITTPIIMRFLEEKIHVESLTLMVQREAAIRLCSQVGSREAGAVSVAVEYYSIAERLFSVPRTAFLPSPNVDSEVISLKIRKAPPLELLNEKFFFNLVRAAFSLRRKTAQNGISSGMGIGKDTIVNALVEIGEKTDVRAEKLSLDKLAELSNILYQKYKDEG